MTALKIGIVGSGWHRAKSLAAGAAQTARLDDCRRVFPNRAKSTADMRQLAYSSDRHCWLSWRAASDAVFVHTSTASHYQRLLTNC